MECQRPMADELTMTDIRVWGRTVRAGEYLAIFDEGEAADDPGSRCGYADSELQAAKDALRARGLVLVADDRGLIVLSRTGDTE